MKNADLHKACIGKDRIINEQARVINLLKDELHTVKIRCWSYWWIACIGWLLLAVYMFVK